ncbi:MAG: cytochrome c peroxidase [Candidatus Promineifilaceae bacterium]|jgi:cytochrome c peroxidase
MKNELITSLLRHISCLAVLLLTISLSTAAAQQTLQLNPVLTNGVLTLTLADSDLGLNHWRIESANNWAEWIRYSSADALAGTGTCTIVLGELGQDAGMVTFRAVLDSSAENVLNLPPANVNYSGIVLPPHLQGPQEQAADNTPTNNAITDAGATLGRVLFYDKKLSINHQVACASCHQQANGFSDPDPFSRGFEGGLTGRNSMGLSNAKFYERGHFFWDERANTLEDQVLQPIQNAVEMGMTLTGLVSRLEGYQYYTNLFADAYGDSTITTNRISAALAQFVRSIVSFRSKFDAGIVPGTNFSNFTALEQEGQQIFTGPRGNCAACHSGPNFVGTRIDNNGLEFPYVDLGVGGVTSNQNDLGKFKMSSLRNIEYTAPYMHDGRFATLEDVVDHYSTGVVDNPNLGPPLRGPPPPPPPAPPPPLQQKNFTQQEKDALVAFMKALSDPGLRTDPIYSDPFQ